MSSTIAHAAAVPVAATEELGVFDLILEGGHEQIVFCSEPSCGYRGIIAIHDTTLGPALGGTRMWNYANDREALVDVLRLARGMTYKAAVAGLNLGGGKSVIIGDPKMPAEQRELVFRAHGRFVETLKGRYITAEDVGTSVSDMDFVAMETSYVTGTSRTSGDPSPVTAYGVYRGIKACAQWRYGDDSLRGKVVTVQGVGHVGEHLVGHLVKEGAKVIVADIDPEKVERVVQEYRVEAVPTEEILGIPANVFAPCALGGVINDESLERLRVDIVAGAANNVLAEPRHGDELHRRGILYAPDYVINAGGLINVFGELNGWTKEQALRKAGDIYATLLRIFQLAQEHGWPTHQAADRVAEARIAAVAKLHRTWV